MKNILVTGGAGYIGSHIVEQLVKKSFLKIKIFYLKKQKTSEIVYNLKFVIRKRFFSFLEILRKT